MTDNPTVSQDPNPVSPAPSSADAQSLERIKEILFGDRVTEIMQQISDMDTHLSQQLSYIEQRMDEKLETMGQQLTETIERVRQQSLENINQIRAHNALELEEFRQQCDQNFTVIRQDIDTASSSQEALHNTMAQALQENSTQLEQTMHQLTAQVQARCLEQTTALHQQLEYQQQVQNRLKSKLSSTLSQLAQEI